jgi:hypothetical protein
MWISSAMKNPAASLSPFPESAVQNLCCGRADTVCPWSQGLRTTGDSRPYLLLVGSECLTPPQAHSRTTGTVVSLPGDSRYEGHGVAKSGGGDEAVGHRERNPVYSASGAKVSP